MKGLYLKIINDRDDSKKVPKLMRLSEVRINEASNRTQKLKIKVGAWMQINKEPEHKGSIYQFLKCVHCSHEDFNEGGERLCDYVCNGCGLTISAHERGD